jgi:hypothetical protein
MGFDIRSKRCSFNQHHGGALKKKSDLNLHHFKIGLRHTAIGAFPICWYISPHSAWSDSILWKAFGLVVNKSTHNALPRFHIHPLFMPEMPFRHTEYMA